ncbi:endomembrane protein 70 [Ostertagia ostertagi]
MSTHLLSILLFLGLFPREQGFYVPGVAPVEFKSGDPIEVKAIKLSSTKTIVPYEYYYLPFCRPDGDLLYKSENLGEVMRGDRIVNTPYQLFNERGLSMFFLPCTKAEPGEVSASAAKRLMDRIKEDYHAHLLVDNLPSATKYEVPKTGEVFYDLGYKIGWVGEDGKVFLNNHLDIVMLYHEHMPGLYRVVGFEVKPRSIKSVTFTKDKKCTGIDKESNFYELKEEGQRIHWTYSVTWEISDIPWASRWDVYLSVKAVDIHWFSILNSIVVVLSLSGK